MLRRQRLRSRFDLCQIAPVPKLSLGGTPRQAARPLTSDLVPRSPFPVPCSLFPVPCSTFADDSDSDSDADFDFIPCDIRQRHSADETH
jgi:hypothetical protein